MSYLKNFTLMKEEVTIGESIIQDLAKEVPYKN